MSGSIPAPVASRHLAYLDGLRGLAALFVVLHHCWYEIWTGGRETAPAWTHWLFFGHLSVDVFIVLSGFCLMLPVVRAEGTLRGGSGQFFKRRAWRILPPYYAATAFSLLLIWTLIGHKTGERWDYALPVTGRGIAAHLLLVHNFLPNYLYQINYAFWSISLEWWIYFLFPVLVLSWKRLGPLLTTVLAAAFSMALALKCLHHFGNSFTLQYIALFVFGMLGAELARTTRPRLLRIQERLPWGLLTIILTAATLLAINGKLPHIVGQEREDFVVGLWATSLLVLLALRPASSACRAFSQKPFVALGTFGYSLYLIHAPLIQVIVQYLLPPLHLLPTAQFWVIECLGVPLIVAVAYGFHLAFERPFVSKPSQPAPKTSVKPKRLLWKVLHPDSQEAGDCLT